MFLFGSLIRTKPVERLYRFSTRDLLARVYKTLYIVTLWPYVMSRIDVIGWKDCKIYDAVDAGSVQMLEHFHFPNVIACLISWFVLSSLYLLPPASAVEVIELEPSVRVCVHSHNWTVSRMDNKFDMQVCQDHILVKFDGQGHRSKVKVMRSKNVISMLLGWDLELCTATVAYGVKSWRHLTSQHDVIWRHSMTSYDVTMK